MRSPPLSLPLLLLSAALLPGLAGAAAAPEAPVLQDAAGDVAVLAGGDAGAPVGGGGAADAVDLTGLRVAETVTDLAFTVTVAAWEGSDAGGVYSLDFAHGDVPYRVRVNHPPGATDGDAMRAVLARGDGDGAYYPLEALSARVDAAADAFTVTVPKARILDAHNRAPAAGTPLTGLRVLAQTTGPSITVDGTSGPRVADRMPDGGAGAYAVRAGPIATGHLHLASTDPVRATNGGGTTLVYEATLTNRADFADAVTLRVDGLPDGWRAEVAPAVHLPAGEARTVHVLVTLPFAHQHGGLDTFTLNATSGERADATAALTLGVAYTRVPQPAGHHPDLYLHADNDAWAPFDTLAPWTRAYLNADPDHADDAAAATATSWGLDDGAHWRMPLGPTLAMGLDFDTDADVHLRGRILGGAPGGPAEVTATLQLTTPDGAVTLARTATPAAVNVDPAGDTPFDVALTPTRDAEYVPYAPDQNLVLLLNLTSDGHACCAPAEVPRIPVDDFRLTLPLREYHDRPPAVYNVTAGPDLLPHGPPEKSARPGATVAYAFTLFNRGDAEDRFTLELAGGHVDAAAARLVDAPKEVRLAPGGQRDVRIEVTIPADANPGERFEVLLLARSTHDAAQLAMQATGTTADPHAAADPTLHRTSAEGAPNGDRDTPAPVLALTMGAVAVAAAGRGRRRGT